MRKLGCSLRARAHIPKQRLLIKSIAKCAVVKKAKGIIMEQCMFLGKLPTYPSPNLTLKHFSRFGQNVRFREGLVGNSQTHKLIHINFYLSALTKRNDHGDHINKVAIRQVLFAVDLLRSYNTASLRCNGNKDCWRRWFVPCTILVFYIYRFLFSFTLPLFTTPCTCENVFRLCG